MNLTYDSSTPPLRFNVNKKKKTHDQCKGLKNTPSSTNSKDDNSTEFVYSQIKRFK